MLTQDTQEPPASYSHGEEHTIPSVATGSVAEDPLNRRPEVTRGHTGIGAHKIHLSTQGAPLAKEVAAPVPHYVKRKRGPDVSAPGLILHKEGGDSVNTAVTATPSDSMMKCVAGADLRQQGEPDSVLDQAPVIPMKVGNFPPGGYLRTVPTPSEQS